MRNRFKKTMSMSRENLHIDTLLIILLIFFLLGICFACIIVSYEQNNVVSFDFTVLKQKVSFPKNIWKAGQFHVFVILASMSYIGLLLIPAIIFLRGYFIACTSAVLLKEYWIAWITCGVPAVIQLPSLFLLASMCLRISAKRWTDTITRDYILKNFDIPKYLILSCVGIILCAIYNRYLVSSLISLFIS